MLGLLLRSSAARRLGRFIARLVGVFGLGLALLGPARDRLAGSRRRRAENRARSRQVLTSLYDRYPNAGSAGRRPRGLQAVPLDAIVGTARNPSQNTADFQPLPLLRGRNWDARWQRITSATERLEVLPPVELLKVGDDYFVVDGHNRMAAALAVGAVAIDADVTELVMEGTRSGPASASVSSSLVGTEALRQAGSGRHSRALEQRTALDQVTRQDLLRASGDNPRPAGEATDIDPVVGSEESADGGEDGPSV